MHQYNTLIIILSQLHKTRDLNGGGGSSSSSSAAAAAVIASSSSPSSSSSSYQFDTRVEDGKLFYQKRWFRRGQAVLVEPKNGEKYPAMISAIG